MMIMMLMMMMMMMTTRMMMMMMMMRRRVDTSCVLLSQGFSGSSLGELCSASEDSHDDDGKNQLVSIILIRMVTNGKSE